MSVIEGQPVFPRSTQLKELAPGVWGRSLPKDEMELKPEAVYKLADQADSQLMKDFIYRLYGVTPPKK